MNNTTQNDAIENEGSANLLDAIKAANDTANESMSVTQLEAMMRADKAAGAKRATWLGAVLKAGVKSKVLGELGSVERNIFETTYAKTHWTAPERALAAKTTAEAKLLPNDAKRKERSLLIGQRRSYLARAIADLKILEAGGTLGSHGGSSSGNKYTPIEKAMAGIVAITEVLEKDESSMALALRKAITRVQDTYASKYEPAKAAFKKVSGDARQYTPTISLAKKQPK
jgi:L-asparaginase/Glu-tRNA(Gln) amidotransferase subunit D